MVEVGRIARSVDQWGERFLQRVYTDAEQAYCGRRAQQLAGRFAAKEAVGKALGTGIGALRWRDIEVLPDHRGKPAVILHGQAAARAQRIGVTWFSLSITHTDELALVFVIAG
jgi:holo-[acyl-carrier protein] synthase